MANLLHVGLLSGALLSSIPAAAEAPAALPIARGVWVKSDTPCNVATIAHVYSNDRFGSVYFYGPNQSMGPANETEPIVNVGRGQNGFSIVNEGPLEVAARPNGQAIVRAFSLSQGVQWTETVRLCSPEMLSPKMHAGLTRAGLLPLVRPRH